MPRTSTRGATSSLEATAEIGGQPAGAIADAAARTAAVASPIEPAARVAGATPPAYDGLVVIRAPMVGRFYRAPGPGAPPFVDVGSLTQPEDVIGIVEVMKLMSQITAGVSGRVVAIPTANGEMVEYGQPLVVIEPIAGDANDGTRA